MKLYLCIGMIASGKSSWARTMADAGAVVVCHDDLTEMLHTRYRYEQPLRDEYRSAEEALVKIFLAAGRDVVVDRTHLTRESRQRWTDFAFSGCYPLEPAIVAVPFQINRDQFTRGDAIATYARRRFYSNARGRSLDEWMKVAAHHYEQAIAEPLDWKAEKFDAMVIPEVAHGS